MGCIPFLPLEQGLLTDKYLYDTPEDPRWDKPHGFLNKKYATPDKLEKVRKLNVITQKKNQTLAKMAIAW